MDQPEGNPTPGPTNPDVLCQTGSLWPIGVAASLVASVAYTSGFLLQKKAHLLEESRPADQRARSFAGLICTPKWLFGLVIVVVVSIPFDFVAFTEAGEALAAPLKSFAIILNQVMAPCMLGEKLQFWDYISTLLVIIGCTITTIFGPHVCQTYSVDELYALFGGLPFMVTESVLLMFSLFAALVIYRRPLRVDYGWVNHLAERFECPLVAFFAGAMGVQVNILMKCIGGMVQDDIFVPGSDNYQRYFFWLTGVICLFFTLAQLSIVNQGLAVFEAVKFMPMMVVIFILGCSVVGGIYYKEFDGFRLVDWVMFPCGCVIILAGVLLLTLTEDKAKRLYLMENSMDTMGREPPDEYSFTDPDPLGNRFGIPGGSPSQERLLRYHDQRGSSQPILTG